MKHWLFTSGVDADEYKTQFHPRFDAQTACLCACFAWMLPTKKSGEGKRCLKDAWATSRVGQNRICTPYMTIHLVTSLLKVLYICRVGQNHIYMVCIRYSWQGNHQIYVHIRCIYTVLVNPIYMYIQHMYTALANPRHRHNGLPLTAHKKLHIELLNSVWGF